MSRAAAPTSEPECVLVLQGGGALGSYQGGVYEALAAAGEHPAWVAGISIGAINAALIAGNPPERRVERLRTFWDRITGAVTVSPWWPGDDIRTAFNTASAVWSASVGVKGFFAPRTMPPVLVPSSRPETVSIYDTAPLRQTLLELVDFDLINSGAMRLSVGAVNVATGNFAYFDNTECEIGPEHIMASGALPPGFPPVKIGEEYYWDGGLVSNTPLHYVVDHEPQRDMTIYQVDLFSARGPLPRTVMEATEREKDIRYSSRTRFNTDSQLRIKKLRTALARLLRKLPASFADDPDAAVLRAIPDEAKVTVVQLIYRERPYEGGTKDFEFSRATMLEHWHAGAEDARQTMQHRGEIKEAPTTGAKTFDIHRVA